MMAGAKLCHALPHVIGTKSDVRGLREQIGRVKRSQQRVPLVLVGNKADLAGPGGEREVAEADGRALAREWGCPFLEASAKTRQGVDELFAEVVREMSCVGESESRARCAQCSLQ